MKSGIYNTLRSTAAANLLDLQFRLPLLIGGQGG
jgi:hypothetical protein